MVLYNNEIDNIKNQIINKFHPKDIYIFGSHAKGMVTRRSDIDICVVIDTNNKRKLLQELLVEIDYDTDIDIIIYTPEEWEKYKNDSSTFANIIFKTGVSIIG